MTSPAWSVNLTDPSLTRQLTDAECEAFTVPLFITGQMVCAEVVFWSGKFQEWIVLVGYRTARVFPKGSREVASGEMDMYARALLGVG